MGSIAAEVIATGQSTSLDLTPYFSDADGDALTYAAIVSDVAIASVTVSGDILTIVGVAPGVAVVTVFAGDPDGLSATQQTRITVGAPNRGPEPIGTIPGQALAPGQWVSITVSSYFRDPEGDALSFSATTSNAAVASVAVSGDIVTITHAGTGTAIVNMVARDPGGLAVQQSIAVTAGAVQATPEPVQPDPAPLPRAEPGVPDVDEAGVGEQAIYEARQPEPFPPRLLAGFVESTGYTLAQGRGHVSAGYLGASSIGEIGDVWPGVGQASYGVTDDLTVTAGLGFYYERGDSEQVPYFAPKFRVWDDEQISGAVGGYVAVVVAEGAVNTTRFAASIAQSIAVNDAFAVHVSGGVYGASETVAGETSTERLGVFAVGGDYRVTPELGLAGELRRVGFEDGNSIVTAGLRFLRNEIGGEAGFAYNLEDRGEIRPIVSVGYRF